MNKHISTFLVGTLLAGCGTVAKTSGAGGPLSSRTGPVCLLAGDLPAGVKFTQIGIISATKRSYGGTDEILKAMADEGRRIGADVITNAAAAEKFRGPIPWRAVAPSGRGVGVRLLQSGFVCEDSGGKPL